MHRNYLLTQQNTGLLIIDVQELLVNQVENACEVLYRIQQTVKGFQIFKLPIVVTEQYPQGLGRTNAAVRECLGVAQHYFTKTTFSCLDDAAIHQHITSLPIENWVIIGLEAHICVFQTAKSLLSIGKQVVVLNDAITSRSIYDFSTGIAELRDIGARISSVETVLFEILRHSEAPEFKAISQLVKG